MENKISKVSLLWVIIMVGFMAHIAADILPAFWGANIAMPDSTGEASMGMIMFMMTMAFFVPMCGLLCMNYRKFKVMRVINLVFATVMMLFNFFHTSELFMEFNPVQLIILLAMAVLGVYLFVYSLRMVKEKD
ncbi:MAG: hypothetical protein IKP45_04905 [Bacteroidales bacterium]|nr:hypothetical protein [Bacteroidales bacterium]